MNKTNLATVFELPPEHKDEEEFGDGEDGGDSNVETIQVEIATNGFMLTYIYDDGSSLKYILNDFDEVLKHMRSNF